MKRFVLVSFVMLLSGVAGCGDGDQDSTGQPGRDDGHEGHDHAAETAAAADWCEEHQIAESQCPFCNPELIQTLGWCRGHEVPEAFCTRCNPALIPAFQAVGDWCAGHDLPESQCTLCNPELASSPAGEAPTGVPTPSPDGSLGSAPPSSDLPRSQRHPAVYCTTQDLVVRFDSPDIARDVGLEIAAAERRPVTKTIECNARLTYDGNRYARLSSVVPGVVAVVHRDLGAPVEAGEPLVSVTSAALGSAKAAFLQAKAAVDLWTRNHSRENELLSQGVGTERDVLEAERGLAEGRIAVSRAEQELLRLGLSAQQIGNVARTGDTSPTYVLTAPFAGIVVERGVALGEVVDPARTLFAVADVSRVWALLDVFESDAAEIRAGQPVVLTVDGLRGETVGGEIGWVASHVDPRTRTVEARAELENPDGFLKANMFARAIVAVRERHPAVVVPVDAVQWEGCCNVVFVKRTDVLYEPRKVHLGVHTGSVYEVLRGLSPGDEVVTQGSFLLKTELLKGSIGAGCCEVQPGV